MGVKIIPNVDISEICNIIKRPYVWQENKKATL